MAAIDRQTLLTDVKMWLPATNVLTDEQILVLAEQVISEVGDDDEFYEEIRCKTLRSCGEVNKSLASGNGMKGVRRQKSYQRELENHENYDPASNWADWLDNLPCLCNSLGYDGLASKRSLSGGVILQSPPVSFPEDCDCPTSLGTKYEY